MTNIKILLIALPFMLMACSKGGDSTPTPTTGGESEVNISFIVEIASAEIDYTKTYGAFGGTQVINVKITSALPKDGVTIDVKVTKDADPQTIIFNRNITATTSSNAITISGLLTEKSTAEVIVTSKNKDTNKATRTFKIAAK
jgi:hypothetical protein